MIRNPAETAFAYVPVEAITPAQWEELVSLNEAALRYGYHPDFVAHPKVRQAAGLDDVEAYADRLRQLGDPDNQPKTNQRYANPHATLAVNTRTNVIASWVLSADNTSGDDAIEKLNIPTRRWQWLGWMATHPAHSEKGLATASVTMAMAQVNLFQPVSAYVWPGNLAHGPLARNGLRPVGKEVMLPESPTDPLLTRRYVSADSKAELRRFGTVEKRAIRAQAAMYKKL